MRVVSRYVSPQGLKRRRVTRSPAAPALNAVGDRSRQTKVSVPCSLFLVGGDIAILACRPAGFRGGLSTAEGKRADPLGRVTCIVRGGASRGYVPVNVAATCRCDARCVPTEEAARRDAMVKT